MEAPGAACRAGWPLLFLSLFGCGQPAADLEDLLARCEPEKAAVRLVWMGDRRAPCGERWLFEHAPERDPPASPLGQARRVLREVLTSGRVEGAHSLWLREAGLPRDVAAVHLELLAEAAPVEGLDPWIASRVGVAREDRDAAARLAGWSAWDPDIQRREATLEEISAVFGLTPPCSEPLCLWEFADGLNAPSGVPGRRDAFWDQEWLHQTGDVRLTGLAGSWVGAWRTWVAADPDRDPTRPGAETEPAGALWSGGTASGNAALLADLNLGPPVVLPAVQPAATESPGGRAAALIPW